MNISFRICHLCYLKGYLFVGFVNAYVYIIAFSIVINSIVIKCVFVMAEKESEIPDAPMCRIMRNAGANRVSKTAARQFALDLENIASKISKEAVVFANHAGRKTVVDEDIRLATKKIWKSP